MRHSFLFSKRWMLSICAGTLFAGIFVACSGDSNTTTGGGTTTSSSSGVGGMQGTGGAPGTGGMQSTGGAPGTGGMMQGSGGMGGMPGPVMCQTPADCTNACPPGSMGCTCEATPLGMICVPTCQTNADCPMGPMGQVLVCDMGVCAPGMMGAGGSGAGGMGPMACQTNADCVNACPQGSMGCACAQTPAGMLCTPTCTKNNDCPPGPMGQQLMCKNGLCSP